jgi:Ca2+-binding RTX toxin-like protein
VPLNPPRECVDLVLSAKTTGHAGLRGVSYSLVLQNQGTLTAKDVRLVQKFGSDVQIFIGRSSQRACSATAGVLTCRSDAMEPRTTLAIAVLARPRVAGPLETSVSASAAERDSDPATNKEVLTTRVYPCWIAGTEFPDTIVGTRSGEHICARAGGDTVRARGGNDVVDGGTEADRLDGGSGRDRLIGGRGNDTILARDDERDTIECGWGDDRAFVDRVDRVLRGCERVHRG